MSDQTPTEPQPTAEPPRDDPAKGPRRLFRSRRDRVWAGVAGGLAEYFRVDPVIIRIAFAVSVFIGGLGAFAYIAMALFVPTRPLAPGEHPEPAREHPAWMAWVVGAVAIVAALSWGVLDHRPFHGPLFIGPPLLILALIAGGIYVARGGQTPRVGGSGGVLLRLLLAVIAFGAMLAVAVASAWAGATGHGVVVAVIVIGVGLALIATSGRGNARWLVVPAIVLAAPLGVVSAADIHFADGVGERYYEPSSLADVPADGYEFGVGRVAIDLRSADWQRGDIVPLHVDLGVGQIDIAVPSDVCVSTDVDADVGDIRVPGDESDGVDVRSDANSSATATPRLELSGHVDLGEIRVFNDDEISIRHEPHDAEGSATDLRAACAGSSGSERGQSAGDAKGPRAPNAPNPLGSN